MASGAWVVNIMQLSDDVVMYAPWVIMAGMVLREAYVRRKRIEEKTSILGAAQKLTTDFYKSADQLLSSSDLPEDLKNALYAVLTAVTRANAGRIALKALKEVLSEAPSERMGDNLLARSVDRLRETNPALADEFDDAIRLGLMAVVCGYGPNDENITFIVGSAERESLAKFVATIAGMIKEAILRPAANNPSIPAY